MTQLNAQEIELVRSIKNLPGYRLASRLRSDHRQLRAGDIFFAWAGRQVDSRQFLSEAVCKGAIAIVFEGGDFTIGHSLPVPSFVVPGLRERAGLIASALLDHPSLTMNTVAVTGTNGKTSVTRWVAQALSFLGERAAVVGTLGGGFVDQVLTPLGLTTPDAICLQQSLRDLQLRGAKAVALEASSIGLEQGRLRGAHFEVVALTNFSRDHLDYHHTLENYANAKKMLAQWPCTPYAVVNMDDSLAAEFAETARATGKKVIGVTRRLCEFPLACDEVWSASDVEQSEAGLRFTLVRETERIVLHAPLIGDFNVENLLVTAAILSCLRQPLDRIAASLATVTPPPGRMQLLEKTEQTGRPLVVVDYAHTPTALEKALAALRPLAAKRGGRLLVLFGCGGNRDAGKRPQMGAVAARLADGVWLTNDNPRDEDPQSIVDAIHGGIEPGHLPGVQAVLDRRLAIEQIIVRAQSRDVVLLAGKGHETTQTIRGEVLPFSDIECARAVLAARGTP
ncbi:MAG: UDP-N-acetylmuramoyl-L-alanyl-D-glutamate--2,6-diaminopimelate ligase [Burkholderiaceae bacterium]|jgi:UDP-N-acetylmuramoyl-L-alanyl-D-glutamate--2,6-diaminopimelate ligase